MDDDDVSTVNSLKGKLFFRTISLALRNVLGIIFVFFQLDNLDQEALQDLEARLYAQVHHEQAVDEQIVAPDQLASSSQQSSRRFNRYWNDVTPKNSGNLVSKRVSYPETRQTNNSPPPKETVGIEKGPSPPKMIVPQASGSDHGEKGSELEVQNTESEKNVFAKPQKLPKSSKAKTPFANKVSKLERAKKLEQKKKKKEQLKAKRAKKKVETIVIETSDDNDDEVQVIPIPPPPCFTIDDSSSEEDKPNSRCPSPTSSVTSDDFIGQQDRSRLIEENQRADDVDLAELQDSLSSFQDALKPQETTAKTTPKDTEYVVTEPNFKAIDIYEESEQDIPDSVYQKGSKSETLEIRDSSSSLEEIPVDENVRKNKKFRKRRASSSNKESENQSTSDEDEGESNPMIPPYLVQGIAVEKCKEAKIRRKSQSSKHSGDIHSSDNEFINKITSIATGTIPEDSSDDEDEEEEPITARAIVEDILQKSSKKGENFNYVFL